MSFTPDHIGTDKLFKGCDHHHGTITHSVIMSRKDAKKFFDPKTTDRVKKNIIKRATVNNLLK